MGFKIAIVGATGNVVREMLNILEERGFPADEVVAAGLSDRSLGTEVSFGDKTLKVRDLATYDFFRHRHLPDVERRQRFEGMVAQDRPARAAS